MEQEQSGCGSDPNNQPEYLLTEEEEIQHLISVTQQAESTSTSFTALLELPPTQAMELLHSPDPNRLGPNHGNAPPHFNASTITFPTNSALIERAAKFSVFADEHNNNNSYCSPETSNLRLNQHLVAVKPEPAESSDPTVENAVAAGGSLQRPSAKRKEREKKGGGTKKSRSPPEDGEKLPYVHVRARRGQATDNHSLAERARREKINARMKLLQELVPGCNKISGTALILDEIINHVQYLQRQVEFLSMRLAAVNPRININLDNILAAESGSLVDSNFLGMVTPLMWPDIQADGSRQQYQQQWHFDGVHQPVWVGEEDNNNFVTPEQSLLSYDSSGNSGTYRALFPGNFSLSLVNSQSEE